jgi:hypothetical protein
VTVGKMLFRIQKKGSKMPDSKDDSLRELYLKAGSALTLIPDEVWKAYHEKTSEDDNNKPPETLDEDNKSI